jgi:hypothetical protein
MTQQVVIVDPSQSIRRAGLDASTYAQIGIDYQHHKIHDGNSYIITQRAAKDALDENAPLTYYIITPDTTKWAHMTAEINLADGGYFEVFEDTGVAAEFNVSGGTSQTPINLDRNSSNTSGLTITYGSTVTAATSAALIYTESIGGKKGAGSGATRLELILKQNTEYLARLSTHADNNEGSMELAWYEHTNKASG